MNEERIVLNKHNEELIIPDAFITLTTRERFILNLGLKRVTKFEPGMYFHLVHYPSSGKWAIMIDHNPAGFRIYENKSQYFVSTSRLFHSLKLYINQAFKGKLPGGKISIIVNQNPQQVGDEVEYLLEMDKFYTDIRNRKFVTP